MTNPSTIHIATTCNDAYFPGLCVTVLSTIIANDSGRAINFHIFDTGLSKKNREQLREKALAHDPNVILEYIAITGEKFSGLTLDYGGGVSTYIRILMGSLIKSPKTIYIDSDFLVLKNLADVYDQDFSDNIVLASKDIDTSDGKPNPLSFDCPFAPASETAGFTYHNCGFLLVDLDAWRSQRIEEACFSLLDNYRGHLKAWDQTVLNYVLRGRFGALDPALCWSCSLGRIPVPGNIHFISRKKPWSGWSPVAGYRLWYLFHHSFLESVAPLAIPLSVKARGLVQYYRDRILGHSHLLELLYIKSLAKRKTPESVALYRSRLHRNRELMQDPDWKCKDLISHFKSKWSRI